MASSLIMHKRIETTTAKAKELKRYVEPLITRSREDSTHSRRVVFSYLQDKEAVTELFREVSAKVGDRPGGYTRIIKLGHRQGDNADMCLIELVDYNENLLAEKAAAKKATGRRRRGSRKKTQETAAPVAKAETAETAETVETAETAETAETVETVETVETAETTETAEAEAEVTEEEPEAEVSEEEPEAKAGEEGEEGEEENEEDKEKQE
jgi:large subunit ribosomal protein L17